MRYVLPEITFPKTRQLIFLQVIAWKIDLNISAKGLPLFLTDFLKSWHISGNLLSTLGALSVFGLGDVLILLCSTKLVFFNISSLPEKKEYCLFKNPTSTFVIRKGNLVIFLDFAISTHNTLFCYQIICLILWPPVSFHLNSFHSY